MSLTFFCFSSFHLPSLVRTYFEWLLQYSDTKKIWDKDRSPSSEDKDWCELSEIEKEAAKTLGYNEAKWDED